MNPSFNPSLNSTWREQPVQTLLMDLDGTLLESHDFRLRLDFIVQCLSRFRRQGGIWRAIRALRAVTRAVEYPSESDRHLTNAERASRAFSRVLGLPLPEATEILHREVAETFRTLGRHFYPVPGAREFIEWASPRYRLVLATNPVWPLEQVLLRVKWAGIDPAVFSAITHSGRMHFCKPSVEYYQELLRQEGLKAEDCALVGDDLRKDLPATRAGISVFILHEPLSKKSPMLELSGALARAEAGSYTELTQLLKGTLA
jgi:FMN phosphatase YigB (HAD superfamily)